MGRNILDTFIKETEIVVMTPSGPSKFKTEIIQFDLIGIMVEAPVSETETRPAFFPWSSVIILFPHVNETEEVSDGESVSDGNPTR